MMNMKVNVLFFLALISRPSSFICCSLKADTGERRLILIGKTGVGKSTTGNSILEKDVFPAPELSATSTTKTCQLKKANRGNKDLLVVDTPGLGDTDLGYDQYRTIIEITKGFALMSPGPHAILLVLKPDKIDKYDEDNLKAYSDMFGSDINKYTITVFTHVFKEKRVMNYISTIQRDSVLSKLMLDTNYRFVIFGDPENKTRRQLDVKILLEKIEEMIEENNPACFLHHASDLSEKALLHVGKGDRDKGREKFEEIFNWLINFFYLSILVTLCQFWGLCSDQAIMELIFHIIILYYKFY